MFGINYKEPWYPTIQNCVELGYTGVISLECGASKHNLCTFDGSRFVQILYKDVENAGIYLQGRLSTLFVSVLDHTSATLLAPDLYLASPEQCIIDMIQYNRPEEYILQALNEEDLFDLNILSDLAIKYNVLDKLKYFEEHKLEIYDED